MFKTWLKSSKKEVDVMVADDISMGKTTLRNYPKEVIEIHNEFGTAADKLVAEANSILKKHESLDKDKVARLIYLGFKKAQQVEEGYKAIEEIKMSEEQINLLNYYKREYPLNKFITEAQVKTICHKYNLVCGDVNRFKGFVPEKNLKEIERFKLKSVDDTNPKIGELYVILDDWSLLKFNDIEKEGYVWLKENDRDFLKGYLTRTDFSYLGTKCSSPATTITGWGKAFQYRAYDHRSDSDIQKAIKRNTQTLQICAPIKDMDISGLELENGYSLKPKYKDIPDPVVLQPIKGGYLILTAWGDESSDPLVTNEINN